MAELLIAARALAPVLAVCVVLLLVLLAYGKGWLR